MYTVLRETRDARLAPFSFYNMLPFTVHLYRKRGQQLKKIAQLKGGETVTPHQEDEVVEGDLMYIFFPDKDHYYNITHPHTLRYDKPVVRLGDIIYESKSPTFYTYSANDISGLWFHNNLPMKVEVWKDEKKIGVIGGYDGATSYLGGSGAKLYLDNDAYGFRLGDKLEFRLFPNSRLYGTLTLTDNFATDVHLGVINALAFGVPAQTVLPVTPDTFTYRIDGTHEISGTTFFTNAATGDRSTGSGDRAAYETVRTSPHAFF